MRLFVGTQASRRRSTPQTTPTFQTYVFDSSLTESLFATLSKQLNKYQMEVATALTRPGLSGIVLIEGPPGTGKTTTIISVVQTLLAANAVFQDVFVSSSSHACSLRLPRTLPSTRFWRSLC